MAEILDSDDDSVCDLTEPEVIDLSADDTDLAAQLNAQLDEYIVIDSDSDDDDVQFVSQSPPKRRKVDEEEEVTFVKSTPARPAVDVDADEALARKLLDHRVKVHQHLKEQEKHLLALGSRKPERSKHMDDATNDLFPRQWAWI